MNMPEQTVLHRHGWQRLCRTIGALALCVMAPLGTAASSVQESFASPEAGVSALVEAVKSNDQRLLRSILGPHSGELVEFG